MSRGARTGASVAGRAELNLLASSLHSLETAHDCCFKREGLRVQMLERRAEGVKGEGLRVLMVERRAEGVICNMDRLPVSLG